LSYIGAKDWNNTFIWPGNCCQETAKIRCSAETVPSVGYRRRWPIRAALAYLLARRRADAVRPPDQSALSYSLRVRVFNSWRRLLTPASPVELAWRQPRCSCARGLHLFGSVRRPERFDAGRKRNRLCGWLQ